MLRDLIVEVDPQTWPQHRVPQLQTGSRTHQINLAQAFLMLGTITMPHLISPASPARFWAWVRYFLSISHRPDLRITMDFADLDPHQKSILSDDFGVAISTLFLYRELGGVAPIVDGRRFMIHFSHLLQAKQKPSKAKVGPSKSPDFVFQDSNGSWHVLECKGTQSGNGARNAFLKTAIAQKHGIQIQGAIRGEQLAAGLSISNDEDRHRTNLRIIDPEDKPLLILGEQNTQEMEINAQKITIARALGVVGLNEAAAEIALPYDAERASEFLRPSEFVRVRRSWRERSQRVSQSVKNRELTPISDHGNTYEGREIRFGRHELGPESKFKEIIVRQGVDRDLLQQLAIEEPIFGDKFEDRVEQRTKGSKIKLETDDNRTTLKYGEILFADIELRN